MESYRKKKLTSKSYNFFTGFHHMAYLESIKNNCEKSRTNNLPKLGYLSKKSSPRISHYTEIRRLVSQNETNKEERVPEADTKDEEKTSSDNNGGPGSSSQQDSNDDVVKPQPSSTETKEEEKESISSKTILNSVEKFEQYLELRQWSHSSLKKNQTKPKLTQETRTDKNLERPQSPETAQHKNPKDSMKYNTGLNFVETFYMKQKKYPDKTAKATKEDENYDDLDYFEKFNKILEKHRQRDLQNSSANVRVPRIQEEEEEEEDASKNNLINGDDGRIDQCADVKQSATDNLSTRDDSINCDESITHNKNKEAEERDVDSTANLNYFEKFYHILEKNRRKNLQNNDFRLKENRTKNLTDRFREQKHTTAHGRGDSDNQEERSKKTDLNCFNKCKRDSEMKQRESGDVGTQTNCAIKTYNIINKCESQKIPPPLAPPLRENRQNHLSLREIKEKFCPGAKIKPRKAEAQEWPDPPRPSSNLSLGTGSWYNGKNADYFETESENEEHSTTITISSRKVSLTKVLHELEVVENEIQQEVRRKSSTPPFAPPTPPPPPPPPPPSYNTNVATRLVENMKTLIVHEGPKSLKEGSVTWDESKSQSEVSMAKFPRETKTAMMMLFNRPKPRSKLPRRLTSLKQVETQTSPFMSATELHTPCVKNLLCTKGLHSGNCYGTSETSLSYTSSLERKYLNLKYIENIF